MEVRLLLTDLRAVLEKKNVTFGMIKPYPVARGNVGRIITQLENEGFRILAIRTLRPDRKLVENHYRAHLGKKWIEDVLITLCSGDVVPMILEHADPDMDAVERLREITGDKDPELAEEGTIRGKIGRDIDDNGFHASDGREAVMREGVLWFEPAEAA